VRGNRRWGYVVALTALAACAFLWLPAAAPAGGCYTASSHVYGYSAYPTYYSYPATYTYYSPAYTPRYEVNEVIVPKAVRAYVAPDYFSSSSDFYRDKTVVDALAGKVTDAEKLRQELAELKAQLKAQPQQPAPQAYYQQPPPQYQMPYAAPQAYQQPQQGYQPQGGTPCDWRAAQAYQQGLQQAQAALQQQGGPGPPQGQGYGPPQGQGYTPAPQPQTGPPSAPPAQPPPPASSPGYGGGGRGTPPESNGNSTGAPRGNDAPAPLPPAGSGRPPEAEARADHGGVPDGLQAVVNEACIRCHGPKNEEMGAGFDMTNLAAVPPEGRMESYAQVLAGAMPHKSAKLPREKARLFREWFRAATQTRKVAAVR
jgi:hypothetical protein